MTESPRLDLENSRSLGWYALKVRTRSELLAASALRDRGYEPFSPVRTERRKYSDRIKHAEISIFPGYVFCKFGLENKSTVLSAPAVEYIVSVANKPGVIAESEISAIRRLIEAGGHETPYFTVGRRVRVQFGYLAGIEGILTRKGSGDELTISVDLLQRSVCLRIDAALVQAL
jgi:transcription antitermination factor NusG